MCKTKGENGHLSGLRKNCVLCLNCDGEKKKKSHYCDLFIAFLGPLKVQKEAAGSRFVLLLVQCKTTTPGGEKMPSIARIAIYCSVLLLHD